MLTLAVRCTALSVAISTVVSSAAAAMPHGQPPAAAEPLPAALRLRSEAAVRRGLEFLRATQQGDGGWTPRFGPAVTAIVAQAMIDSPAFGPRHPCVRRAVARVLTYVQPDGGIYQPEAQLANYQTSVCLMMLCALKDPAHESTIAAAREFLRKLQYDEAESIDPANAWYGGAGYTSRKRPDLSNTQMMLDALRQSGLPPDDPTYRKALRFITRCQMLSETNDQPFARRAGDGGFIYSPANDGESKADTVIVEGRPMLRTYGSMTYAGFKSMLYAGLSRDDPRARKALEWIRVHWTLECNPNMPGAKSRQGLYYYYHVFARALRAWGEDEVADFTGKRHNWRAELCEKLISLQNPDGSWVNPADRWNEGDPNYVTALALLSLQQALAR